MSESHALGTGLVSITPTRRGRYFWAAWWTGAPTRTPFRRPDASNGGAASVEDARREAERTAGRALRELDFRWANAWNRILRGQPPFTPRDLAALDGVPRAPRPAPPPGTVPRSVWSVLGVERLASPEELKRAFRRRALETHPDRGGDAAEFRAVHAAYEEALARRGTRGRR